jgi:hypothetical protein
MKTLLGLFLALMALAPPVVFAELSDTKAHSFHSAATVDGDGTDFVNADKYTSMAVTVTITNTATVTFKVSQNGTDFAEKLCTPSDSTTAVTNVSSTAQVQCNIAGYAAVRMVISACSSCTVTVTGTVTTALFGGGGGGSGATPTFDQVIAQGAETDNATSLANAVKIGGTLKWCIYEDAATGLQLRPCTASDVKQTILTNFNGGFYDEENDCWILQIDPDAASTLAAWTFTCSATKPKKSLLLTADAFYMKSGCTLTTESALITAGLTEPYITCTDNDASGFHRTLAMPDSWDGGTVTFKVFLTNVNATPANDYRLDLSAECEANSEVIGTSISGTGEVSALFDFDNTGTCSTACAQFDLATVTTAAHTVNGTCAGGNLFRINALVDATTTTTAQVADVKIIAVRMEYGISSLSD